jgi:hypothetical protein
MITNTLKCIVITTINNPNENINFYSNLKDWDLIIVSDKKTNINLFTGIKCIFLDLKAQKELFPSFYNKIPFNSYSRKMFGYLYAIKHNYSVIYDTDDDNKYIYNINDFDSNELPCKITTESGFVNLYKNYTNLYIWPRGIPHYHKCVNKMPNLKSIESNIKCSVIQGLVNNDPDVDAYYRINISNEPFTFDDNKFNIILDKFSICPVNTQNTFWTDIDMFYALYLPITVSFRYTDILRGYILLFQLWKNNKNIKFTRATAFKERNQHDLNKDLESEQPMYDTCEQVIKLLNSNVNASIRDIYCILIENNIVNKEELSVLDEWLYIINTKLY